MNNQMKILNLFLILISANNLMMNEELKEDLYNNINYNSGHLSIKEANKFLKIFNKNLIYKNVIKDNENVIKDLIYKESFYESIEEINKLNNIIKDLEKKDKQLKEKNRFSLYDLAKLEGLKIKLENPKEEKPSLFKKIFSRCLKKNK